MELSSTQFVPAPQQRVWDALNDPETLKSCIPGCESIESLSASQFQVVLSAKVGPVAARFKGKMNITDFNPPNSYSLTFEGQGGMAGFAKGGADVRLLTVAGGTDLSYSAKAQVGGKLAQIGSRLVDIAAKKTADDFFSAFVATVGMPNADTIAEMPNADTIAKMPTAQTGTYQRVVPWVAAASVALLIVLWWRG